MTMAALSTSDRARRRLTWAVPVVVAGAVGMAAVVATGSASGAAPNLPPRTAAQLLVAVQQSSTSAFSGVIRETAKLGLPSLAGPQSSASLTWQNFLTGSHSARVWVDGPDKQRVALLGELSEADVVHNGNDVWTYTSETNSVTHTVRPAHSATSKNAPESKGAPSSEPSAADLTPAALAARILKAVSPSTALRVDTAQMVAHRAAYTLVLRPRDDNSTIHKVTIAIDAKKFIPLRVQIFGAGSSPAFTTGFTHISFKAPPASVFKFVLPKGATISTDPFGTKTPLTREHDHGEAKPNTESPSTTGPGITKPGPTVATSRPKIIGSGWTTVLEFPHGLGTTLGAGMLHDLTSSIGTSGARLLHTALINAVILPDGRAFLGALTPPALEHIAATTPR